MLKKKEKFTAVEEAEKLPPNKYEFEFVVVKPGGKSSDPFVVEGEGHTEAEAIEAAKAEIVKSFSEDEAADNIVQYTGKFKKL